MFKSFIFILTVSPFYSRKDRLCRNSLRELLKNLFTCSLSHMLQKRKLHNWLTKEFLTLHYNHDCYLKSISLRICVSMTTCLRLSCVVVNVYMILMLFWLKEFVTKKRYICHKTSES